MPVRKKSSINLLPQDKFASSPLGRILSWLLSTFRVIVVLIELVVMGAFLSRFWLDAKNSDLNDELEQKSALIMASSDFENQFNLTKKRLEIYKLLTKDGAYYSTTPTKLASLIPEDVTILAISQDISSIKLAGVSPTERGIAQLMSNLEAQKDYLEVNLNQLQTNTENETNLGFAITILTEGQGKGEK